jgi:hypothetical protein
MTMTKRFPMWRLVRCPRCYDVRLTLARRGTFCKLCKGPGHQTRMHCETWLN